jgi:biopolymer transport protein ExbD
VLLVILIFLMLSTTYSKFTEMQLKLPVADTDAQRDYPKEVIVAVSADGRYMVNKSRSRPQHRDRGRRARRRGQGGKDSVVIISADATATHQSVITVMEAARRMGLTQITFATQSSAQAGPRAKKAATAAPHRRQALQRAWLRRGPAGLPAVAAVAALRRARADCAAGSIASDGCERARAGARHRGRQRDRRRRGQDAGGDGAWCGT